MVILVVHYEGYLPDSPFAYGDNHYLLNELEADLLQEAIERWAEGLGTCPAVIGGDPHPASTHVYCSRVYLQTVPQMFSGGG